VNTDSSGCKGTDSHLGDSSTRARKLAPPAKTAIPSQPQMRATQVIHHRSGGASYFYLGKPTQMILMKYK